MIASDFKMDAMNQLTYSLHLNCADPDTSYGMSLQLHLQKSQKCTICRQCCAQVPQVTNFCLWATGFHG